MGKSLLVVESPTKMKTLSKFLGKEFVIKATYGHIKDLPKSKLGVDIEKGFTPQLMTVKGKSKVVDELKKVSKDVEEILIGSDPDREGEAIAFHVADIVGKKKQVKRVLFHEITKKGVRDALKSPTILDEAKYDAQKARRILDRLVGYKISPLLWEKVSYGLSAGRVQSVALRLVCDREEEIEGFTKEEYWVVDVDLELQSGDAFKATLEKKGDEKIRIATQDEAETIKKEIEGKDLTIKKIEIKERHVPPQPAFITSRLQQEASRKLKFSPKMTMMLAQRLYEGVDVGEDGITGLITYMRTDSVRVSGEAIKDARQFINENFGKPYLPKTPHVFKNRKTAQDAHEAIRPTYVNLTPERLKPVLEKELFALYDLIWKRFIASQMAHEKLKTKTVDVESGEYLFVARGSEVTFDGFTRIYQEEREDEEAGTYLPPMKEGEKVRLNDTILNQRFTMPPPRYNEASLIRTLETKGIGRPSTYATIVSTVQDRDYAKKDKGRLVPTSLGVMVNKLLKEFFPLIVDVDFTAKMEDRLDLIEDGKKSWVKSLGKFYEVFQEALSAAQQGMKSLKKEEKETDIVCDLCGMKMLMRWGKNGEYIVCSGKPACKNKKNVRVESDGIIKVIEAEIKGICERCGGNLIEKRGRFGRFLACSNYPDCKYTAPYHLGFVCPEDGCTGKLVEKTSKKKKKFTSCSRYPDCSFATNAEPVEGPCPSCGAPTLFSYRKKTSCLRKDCGWTSG
ncbi:type I DNA topoisomerase [Syntrophorhabdus aromaticivorans]|uniref:type I DNA topoisomerase n=1 Tax=Syntrophorhabdus aromaticivorans TaxID=328301 RepID=UPI0004105D84|nr:type I DNA topoisomerase [Syntrophorhabdus aromaticivorans]